MSPKQTKEIITQHADGTVTKEIIHIKEKASCWSRAIKIGAALSLLLICVVIVMAFANRDEASDKAVKRSGGKGTLDNPIPVNEWAVYKDGKVRATRIIRPATQQIKDWNQFNDDPPVGADYVLVWFEVECQKEKCNPAIDLDIYLMQSKDKKWKEPWFVVMEDDLDSAEALKGSTMQGWQVFEFPSGQSIQAIQVRFGGETLYLAMPS